MEYLEIAFDIKPYSEQNAEIVMAVVQELGFESFVMEEPCLKGYIRQDLFSRQALKCMLDFFGNGENGIQVNWSTNLIKNENWNRIWESEFKPIVIGKKCTVKATFHKGLPKTAYNIIINPKMAFGTGHHQTTSMMIKWLLHLGKVRGGMYGKSVETLQGMQVLDMGTGTGVLAVLAAQMGAKRDVHAIDVDINAVNSAKENIYLNRLHRAITVLYGDASIIQASKYDLVLANINRNILLQDMETYSRGLKSAAEVRFERKNRKGSINLCKEFAYGGLLVISGFYTEDTAMLKKRAAECGLRFIAGRSRNNWASLCFAKL